MTQLPVDQAFQWARQQHQSGNLAAAEQVYRQILAKFPNHAPTLHYLGVIAFQVRRFDDAIPLLQRAAAILPDAPDVHHNLAMALQEAARIDEAIAEYNKAIAISPRAASSINGLAGIRHAQG